MARGTSPDAIRPGLSRIRELLSRAGHPERTFRSMQVSGTNGKGSVCAFVASILKAADIGRVGLYTSPHLASPTERIRVDGEKVSEAVLRRLLRESERLADGADGRKLLSPSLFESLTLSAVRHFAARRVSVAICETGLGGRWDAVTAMPVEISVLTSVGIDHTEWLGGTLAEIAGEKAASFRRGVPVVIGSLRPAARRIVLAEAKRKRCDVWESGRDFGWGGDGKTIRLPGLDVPQVVVPLAGEHQRGNAVIAAAAAWRFLAGPGDADLSSSARAIRDGIGATTWPGRLTELPGRANRGVVVDGAHNVEAAAALASEVRRWREREGTRPVVACWSMLADKEMARFVRTLSPAVDRWVAWPMAGDRAASLDGLVRAGRKGGVDVVTAGTFPEALSVARKAAGRNGRVLVTGSLHAVGEAWKICVGDVP